VVVLEVVEVVGGVVTLTGSGAATGLGGSVVVVVVGGSTRVHSVGTWVVVVVVTVAGELAPGRVQASMRTSRIARGTYAAARAIGSDPGGRRRGPGVTIVVLLVVGG